jgi:hypothetical protein
MKFRTPETDNQVHYVYLLVDRDCHRFKIGVSIDPARRAYSLPQQFNLGMSVQVGFSKSEAYRVERILHKAYRDMNVYVGECDGKTEWFCFGCFPAAWKILRKSDALVPLRRIDERTHKAKDWLEGCLNLMNQDGGAWIRSLTMRKQTARHLAQFT